MTAGIDRGRLYVAAVFLSVFTAFLCLAALPTAAQGAKVKTGIEVLVENGFDILAGKRIGLVTNPSGVDSRLNSTVDILFNAPDVELVALSGRLCGQRCCTSSSSWHQFLSCTSMWNR